MLRITVYQKQQALTLQLEGRLTGPWVNVLEECWQSSFACHRKPMLRVDLAGVTFIDEAGQACLAAMHREGAELIAADAMTKAIAAEIAQGPPPLHTEVRKGFGASEGKNEMTLKRVTNLER